MREPSAVNIAAVTRDDRLIDDIVAGRDLHCDDLAGALLAELRAGLHEASLAYVAEFAPALVEPPRRRRAHSKRIAAAAVAGSLVAACAVVGATLARDLGSRATQPRPTPSSTPLGADGRVAEATLLLDTVARRLAAVASGVPLVADEAGALRELLDRAAALLPTSGFGIERARLAVLGIRIASLQTPAVSSPPATPRSRPAATVPTVRPGNRTDDRDGSDRGSGSDEQGGDNGAGDDGSGDQGDDSSGQQGSGSSNDQADTAGSDRHGASDDQGDGNGSGRDDSSSGDNLGRGPQVRKLRHH